MSEAKQVPLLELLAKVPEDARLIIDSKDGLSSHSIPVGRLVAEARAAIAAAQQSSEPVAWIQSNHLQLARQGVHLVRMAPTQHQSDYIPLYTADAIREAVLAEREACASLIEPKNPRSDWTEYAEAKADCAAMIRARGAA